MNLLFDIESTQPNSTGTRHGGGKYGEVVFKRIVERKMPFQAFYDSRKWINPDMLRIIQANNIILYDLAKSTINDIVIQSKADIIYTPLYTATYRNLKNHPIIVTVHGIRDKELPHDYRFRFKYRQEWNLQNVYQFCLNELKRGIKKIIRYQDTLPFFLQDNIDFVTVSNHSAFSLQVFYPVQASVSDKVFYSPSTIDTIVTAEKYKYKYFLLVSGNRWEKNNLRAIIALDSLFTRGLLNDFQVIVTGVSSSRAFLYKLKNSDKFQFRGYVDEQELAHLYHDAYCFIYPSLNEGFGYPPVEAMFYGVPTIASPVSSIPEICQDAVMYANPFSVNELMNRILQMSLSNTRQYYSQRSQARFAQVKKKQDEDLDRLIDYIFSKCK